MGVMATGVHDIWIFRGVGNIVFLLDRQGVHIRPQHKCRSGMLTLQDCDNTRFGHPLCGQPKRLEIGFHYGGRTMLLKTKFGVLMKIPSQGNEFFSAGFNFFSESHNSVLY